MTATNAESTTSTARPWAALATRVAKHDHHVAEDERIKKLHPALTDRRDELIATGAVDDEEVIKEVGTIDTRLSLIGPGRERAAKAREQAQNDLAALASGPRAELEREFVAEWAAGVASVLTGIAPLIAEQVKDRTYAKALGEKTAGEIFFQSDRGQALIEIQADARPQDTPTSSARRLLSALAKLHAFRKNFKPLRRPEAALETLES